MLFKGSEVGVRLRCCISFIQLSFFKVFLFIYLFIYFPSFYFLLLMMLWFLVIFIPVSSFKIGTLLNCGNFKQKDRKNQIKNLYIFIGMIIAFDVVIRLSVQCVFQLMRKYEKLK